MNENTTGQPGGIELSWRVINPSGGRQFFIAHTRFEEIRELMGEPQPGSECGKVRYQWGAAKSDNQSQKLFVWDYKGSRAYDLWSGSGSRELAEKLFPGRVMDNWTSWEELTGKTAPICA